MDNPDAVVSELVNALPGVGVHALSTDTGDGLEQLRPSGMPGHTAVLLGSSGVGKSTLTNRLAAAPLNCLQAVYERTTLMAGTPQPLAICSNYQPAGC